jgi:hypothetical protein
MIITELKELTQILNFEGEYAIFRAKDEQGSYNGVINRHGEILWHWRHITMRVKGYPHIFKTISDTPGFVFYDVEKQAFVEAPIIDEGHKSKAQIMVDNAPRIPFFPDVPGLFDYPSLRYLSDEYVGFSTQRMDWGIQDIDGNIIFPEKFSTLGEGGESNHFVVNNEDEKVGVINEKGEWIIPPIYSELYWRKRYYVAYVKEGRKKKRCGLIDQEGGVIVPFEYDYLMPSHTEDLISTKKRGKYFFINSHNEKIKLF